MLVGLLLPLVKEVCCILLSSVFYFNLSTIILLVSAEPCPCPSPPNNGSINCNESHLAGAGSIVTYSCNSGYYLLGSGRRTCQASGNWSGTTPTCVLGEIFHCMHNVMYVMLFSD